MKSKLINCPYLLWMALFIIAPLIFVGYYAFTDSAGAFTLSNIAQLTEYTPIFLKSIYLGAVAALVSLIVGYPVSYFISKTKPSTQKTLILLIMLPMCMSFLLRTIAWVSLLNDKGLINRAITAIGLKPLKLIRNSGAVVLGMVYNYLPYMILPLYTVMMKIDPRLYEASEDLGANRLETFKRVTFKLSIPGIVSGITMVFVPAVSTFYISNKLGSTSSVMIGDVVETLFKSAYNPNLGAAMSLVLMVLIFVCMAVVNHFGDESEEAVII